MSPTMERQIAGDDTDVRIEQIKKEEGLLTPLLALQLPTAIAMVDNEVPDQLLIRSKDPARPYGYATRNELDFSATGFAHFATTDCAVAQDVPIRSTVLTPTTPTHYASLMDAAQSLFKTLHDQIDSKHLQKIVYALPTRSAKVFHPSCMSMDSHLAGSILRHRRSHATPYHVCPRHSDNVEHPVTKGRSI